MPSTLIPQPSSLLRTFFEKFDTFADAPNAVAKMRELVLGLAIQGKLVEQDPEEGSAAELVDLAITTRNELVAEKKLRKPRKFQPVAEFKCATIPSNWTWTNLAEITEIGPRNDAEDSSEANFLPMPVFPQQYGGKLSPETRKWSEIKKGFTHLADGDIALAKITPCFQNGKSAVIRGLANGVGAGTTELHVARPFAPVLDPFYAWIFLSSPQFIKEGIPHMTGSAGQKRVPTGYFALKPFPLPPLAEQKRIVAKVDALMALCDQLEAQQQARDTQQATLARAALARFADAPTPDNLNGLLNLPLSKNSSLKLHPSSFSSSSFNIHPSSLRKSILTLAVQGKLVPQDPEDETAKEDFPDWSKQEASQDDRPVPKNWITVPLGKLGKWTGGGTPSKSKPEYWNGTIPWVCPKDMKRPLIGSSIDTITKAAVDGSSAKAIQKGSLLMVVRGMILARDFPSAIAACEVTINQDMKSLYPDYPETNLYLHLALCAKKADFLDAVERSSHGTCKLLTKDLHAMEIPIPPMAEQGRIVTKVDQLMALVDELETQLAESRNSGQKVVEALVGELTAA